MKKIYTKPTICQFGKETELIIKQFSELMKENIRLEREADWLAERLVEDCLGTSECCPLKPGVSVCNIDCPLKESDWKRLVTVQSWRKAAREAIEAEYDNKEVNL